MKNLIKIASIFVLIICMGVVFVSCGSEEGKLIGKWEGANQITGIYEYEFFEDGTGNYYCGGDLFSKFTYTYEAGVLTMTSTEDSPIPLDETYDVDELTSDKLILAKAGYERPFKRAD